MVLATRDRPNLLDGALTATVAALRPGDRLLVVDSASLSPATGALCRSRGIDVLRLDRPGTSAARNAGLAAVGTDLVAFTDDDCLPAAGWAAALAGAFREPSVGLVSGRVLPDRAVAAPVSLLLDPEPAPLDPHSPVGHGANVAFRCVALRSVDGFDEGLGPGTSGRAGEDGDAIRRVLLAGWAGRYEPTAVVVHRQWRSRRAALGQSWAYGRGQAAAGSALRGWWDDGLRAAARDLRAGYLTGTAAGLMRAGGSAAGVLEAAARRLDRGRRR